MDIYNANEARAATVYITMVYKYILKQEVINIGLDKNMQANRFLNSSKQFIINNTQSLHETTFIDGTNLLTLFCDW